MTLREIQERVDEANITDGSQIKKKVQSSKAPQLIATKFWKKMCFRMTPKTHPCLARNWVVSLFSPGQTNSWELCRRKLDLADQAHPWCRKVCMTNNKEPIVSQIVFGCPHNQWTWTHWFSVVLMQRPQTFLLVLIKMHIWSWMFQLQSATR